MLTVAGNGILLKQATEKVKEKFIKNAKRGIEGVGRCFVAIPLA